MGSRPCYVVCKCAYGEVGGRRHAHRVEDLLPLRLATDSTTGQLVIQEQFNDRTAVTTNSNGPIASRCHKVDDDCA